MLTGINSHRANCFACKSVKTIIAALFFFLLPTCMSAQQESVNDLLKYGRDLSKEAYLHYDLNKMIEAHSVFEKAFAMDNSSMLPLYYATLVEYKILEISMREGGDSLFDKFYDKALNNADKLDTDKNLAADGKILSAAIYMMKIATSPMSAVALSPKIHALLDESQEINPEKPYSYLIRGMMKFNTPGIFGGS